MIRVRIDPLGHELELQPGERLLDALDEQPGGGIRFECRGAHCGSCAVEVIEGGPSLAPAREDERRTLTERGFSPHVRLGCQLGASSTGQGRVVLRVLGSSC